MKSFLEFVSCCVTTPEVSSNKEEMAPPTATSTETPSRVEVVSVRKKKKVRVGIPGSMNPAEWKPSLHMISEDKVVTEKRERPPPSPSPSTADRAVKKKSNTGSRSKVHVRSYSDDIGQNPVPGIIPTFSPTPFMF